MDGLELYGSEYLRIRFQSTLLDKVEKLEGKAVTLARSPLPRADFAQKHALLVGRFMLGVQNVLVASALDRNDSQPWTRRLSNHDFAQIVWDFYQARNDADQITTLALCLDADEDGPPAFSAAALRSITMLARMLDPQRWGVLTWRSLACLGHPSMTALKQLRVATSPERVAGEFEGLSIGEIVRATEAMRRLISPGLPTTASVAAALTCVSLDLWPVELDFERPDPLAEPGHSPCATQLATV
jgi:hypothetical protein